ncbi:MAG: hypothetical protein ACYTF1_24120 [Planctomycetota bacterium]|jgi:hypothetical protein
MSSLFDIIRERLGFMLSLPERTIRSLAALGAGTTSLLSETLFPEVLRETALYKIFVGDAQRYVVDKVAQIKMEAESEGGAETVGRGINVALETAGLLAMHLSPLWVFALAGDAAAGGSVFLNRLVEQLKRNGVLPEEADIKGINDLLVVMRETAEKGTSAIERPPLSREEIIKLSDEMVDGYKKMFAKVVDLVPRLDTLWKQIEDIARKENITVERVSGILTVDIPEMTKKGMATALAVGITGTDLFGENVLASYAQTLERIGREGGRNYVNERLRPFVEAAADHLDPAKKTWTESMWESATTPKAEAEAGAESVSDIPQVNEDMNKGG